MRRNKILSIILLLLMPCISQAGNIKQYGGYLPLQQETPGNQSNGNFWIDGHGILENFSITGAYKGGFTVSGLDTPGTPTITVNGTVGVTTWAYKAAANSATGRTLASTVAGSTTTGNATLSASNYNTISGSVPAGAKQIVIYRTTAGGTPNTTGIIGTVTVTGDTYSLDDTGLAGGGEAIPTSDTSALVTGLGGISDAQVLTNRAEASLSAEINLGALSTGLLKGTVAAGVSTISAITDSSANWDTAYGWGDHSGLHVLTDRAEAGLSAEVDLGSLASGFLYGTVAAGVSTVSSIGSTGTGSVVLATSPTFITSIISPIVYGSAADSGGLTLASTSSATKGDISVGRLTLSDLANATGLTFGSLGTATIGIDLSGSGLSGGTDYWIYNSSVDYWRTDGMLQLGTNYYTAGLRTNRIQQYASQNPFIIDVVSANNAPLNLAIGSLSPSLFGTNIDYKNTGWSSTATSANITKTAHGLSLAVGDFVEIYTSSTAADKQIYSITALPDANTVTLDRVLSGTQTDVGCHFYKDVVGIFASDGTNGQRIMNYSHQNKPLQLGGNVLVATGHSLVSTDVLVAGNNLEIDSIVYFDSDTVFSQTQAAGALTGTLTNSVATGDPAIYVKVKVGASYYAVPGWLIP